VEPAVPVPRIEPVLPSLLPFALGSRAAIDQRVVVQRRAEPERHLGFVPACKRGQGYTTPIQTSIAGGGVWNNPLKRDRLDQIGIGIAWDQAAPPPANPPDARDEWVVEAYWAWTFFKGFQITPDLQFYVHPALNPGQGNARVFSLRGLVLF